MYICASTVVEYMYTVNVAIFEYRSERPFINDQAY